MDKPRAERRDRWGFSIAEAVVQDLRFGARALLRSPVFTAAVILTLALGIGANTAIFTLLNTVALRLLPVEAPAELYVLGSRSGMGTIQSDGVPDRDTSLFSYRLFQDLRRHTGVFSGLAAVSSFPVNAYLSHDSAPQRGRGAPIEKAEARLVSGDFFAVLGVPAILGRTLGRNDNRTPGAHPVAVVSHAFWGRILGRDPNAVGRSLHLNGGEYTVVGVTPPDFLGVTVGRSTDLWIPLAMQSQLMRGPSDLEDRNTMWLRLIGRLRPGITAEQAAARTNDLFHRLLMAEAGSEVTVETRGEIGKLTTELVPFAKGFSRLRRQYSRPLVLLMTVVALVLLIACANVGNLQLARASKRQREMAVRLALGAGRRRLLRQLLTESLILALLGGALGLVVARWTVRLLLGLISGGEGIPLAIGLDSVVLAFTFAVSLGTALAFGLAPASRATRFDIGPSLTRRLGEAGEPRRGGRLRRILVISQVAVTLFLLVGAGLFLRSLSNLRHQDAGFRSEGVLLVEIDPQGAGYAEEELTGLYRRLVERIEALPNVESASLSLFPLLTGSRWVTEASVDGFSAEAGADPLIEATFVTPGYFETVGATLLVGRPLDGRDRQGAPRVAVVNQAFARYHFAGRSPVGRRFGIDGEESAREIEIVGMVNDLRSHDLRQEAPRLVYFSAAQRPDYLSSLEVRSRREPAGLASQVRAAIAETAPGLPVLATRTLRSQLDRSLREERLLSSLTGFFALLALLLAAIGLYGVLAYGVAQRTHEIGIRMAIGAPRRQVLGMVLRRAMGWVGVGVVFGLAAALAAGRLVSSLLFGLAPSDPATILLATAALILVAALAAYLPAHRASRLDPLQALRYE
jgi:predicted permease